MRETPLRRSLCAAACVATLTFAGGCQYAALIADRTAGQTPVEPQYKPDPLKPLLVLVENYRINGDNTSDADRVARLIGARLAEQKVAPIVDNAEVVKLRDRDAATYRRMGVAQVGQAVGAGQVLYVDLTEVGIGTQSGSDVAKGTAGANVRFIDATTGIVAYPAGLTDGQPVAAETPARRLGDNASADTLRVEALTQLSDKIARLFYRYKPADIDVIGDEDMNTSGGS